MACLLDWPHKTWEEVFSFVQKNASGDKTNTSHVSSDEQKGCICSYFGSGNRDRKFPQMSTRKDSEHLTATLDKVGLSSEQMKCEWKAYVSGKKGIEKDHTGQGLLSRIFAFRLMTTPYIIAHLRLGLFLEDDEELPFVLKNLNDFKSS